MIIDGKEGWALPEHLKPSRQGPQRAAPVAKPLKFSGPLTSQKWFAGSLGRSQCKEALFTEAAGAFLVNQVNPKTFSLVVALGAASPSRKFWFGMIQMTDSGR